MNPTPIIIPTIPIAKRVIFQVEPDLYQSTKPIIQHLPIDQIRTTLNDTHQKLLDHKGIIVESQSNGQSAQEHHSNQFSDCQTVRNSNHHKTIVMALNQLNFEVRKMYSKIEQLHQRLDAIQDSEGQKIKKKRRKAQQIQKAFQCPYDDCGKSYGTQVSLNLHIKLKHNGGTKTQRQQFIRLKLAGHNVQPNLTLPPEMLKSIEEMTSSK